MNMTIDGRCSYCFKYLDTSGICDCQNETAKKEAVACPVCKDHMGVSRGLVHGIGDGGACPMTKCHGCDGKCWIVIQENNMKKVFKG